MHHTIHPTRGLILAALCALITTLPALVSAPAQADGAFSPIHCPQKVRSFIKIEVPPGYRGNADRWSTPPRVAVHYAFRSAAWNTRSGMLFCSYTQDHAPADHPLSKTSISHPASSGSCRIGKGFKKLKHDRIKDTHMFTCAHKDAASCEIWCKE